MAMGLVYRCDGCGFSVETWDEGNPYILDDKGEMHDCSHPRRESTIEEIVNSSVEGRGLIGKAREAFISSRVGNQDEFLCLDCGADYRCDKQRAEPVCPKCRSMKSCDTWQIEGIECPKCRKGIFAKSEGGMMIS